MKDAKQKRLNSQITKKQMKNQARLPRTAGIRTLTDLSESLTKAGLDPSRIQERAEMIAKTRAAQRKRKRDDADVEMDVDMDVEENDNEEWMDVDDDASTPKKRAKTNSGAIAAKNKREPRSNRQLAGMRDDAVSHSCSSNEKSKNQHTYFISCLTASIKSSQTT